MSPLEAAAALEAAIYAENDKLHAGTVKWPHSTANAILQGKTYAHRVRRFLGCDATEEARTAFKAIRWDCLRDVIAGNADLRSAYEALRVALPRP